MAGVMITKGRARRPRISVQGVRLSVRCCRGPTELNAQIEAITVRGDRHAPAMMQVLDG